ncbi:hypothetical protein [Pseudomonas sp. MWU13-2105]|uniref:hypothetical protein n=1 Tax=Pseudomonas sp. MWU13-2105 TaxID=2935074 RepID=UPI00200E71FB|nr:hypothetical protein [Pseudomonas sp. MWU13-2105]
MDNKTIRWVADSMVGLGAGAAITGFSTLYLLTGGATPEMLLLSATLFVTSLFCFVFSYVCAVQEVEQ